MWFSFNGISSEELGLILPNTVFRPSWAELTEEITIPGRAEVIKQTTGIYENQQLPIPCVVTDARRLKDIYSLIHGNGKLILSTAPNEYINARAEVLVPNGVALDMAELPITFDCSPFAYSVTPTEYALSQSYTEVRNNSTVFTAPIFKFKIKKGDAPILKGDVNFDGVIDAIDASMVLTEYARTSAGHAPTFTPRQMIAADWNDDGVVDAVDASAILDYYAKSSTGGGGGGGTHVVPPTENLQLNVNGANLNIGLTAEIFNIGAEVTVDCGLHLIYYKDMNDAMVNIMQYSSLDLPLLHEGVNFIKYSGANVESAKVIINERWL